MRRLLEAFSFWIAIAIGLHAALPFLLRSQGIVVPSAPLLPPPQEIAVTLVDEQPPPPEPQPQPEPEPPPPPPVVIEPPMREPPPEPPPPPPPPPEPEPELPAVPIPEKRPEPEPPSPVRKPETRSESPPPKPRPAPRPAPVIPAPSATSTVVAREARVQYAPQPRYPSEARRANLEGVVSVFIQISESGRVISASVVQSCGHPALDQAALDALRKWRFDPARNAAGKPVPSALKVPIRFKIEK